MTSQPTNPHDAQRLSPLMSGTSIGPFPNTYRVNGVLRLLPHQSPAPIKPLPSLPERIPPSPVVLPWQLDKLHDVYNLDTQPTLSSCFSTSSFDQFCTANVQLPQCVAVTERQLEVARLSEGDVQVQIGSVIPGGTTEVMEVMRVKEVWARERHVVIFRCEFPGYTGKEVLLIVRNEQVLWNAWSYVSWCISYPFLPACSFISKPLV
jgi:hypothetical protein